MRFRQPKAATLPSSRSKDDPDIGSSSRRRRGWRFWFVFVALCLCLLVVGIDVTSMGTVSPVIAASLGGNASFAWISSAYTLAATAIIPLSGRLSDIFGRKYTLVASLVFFTGGSLVCARANSMNVLIAGRALQGVGNGGIQALTSIIVADLTTLRERGMFSALLGIASTAASLTGPFIGGAIAQNTTWRWIFYMNIPLCVITLAVVLAFLHLRRPKVNNIKDVVIAMDIPGNALIIASTSSTIIALTWAGVIHPWRSPAVLVPLTLGLLGMLAVFVYETKYTEHSSIPIAILGNRTSFSGYLQTFLHGMILMSMGFYLPTWFQAAKLASPFRSGVLIFPLVCIVSPAAIVQAVVVSKTGKYWSIHLVGWSLLLIGLGTFTVLKRDSSVGMDTPMQMVVGAGLGLLYATTFSVLAPLPVALNAQAVSFLMFVRTFSQTWGVALCATILQNELTSRLPESVVTAGRDGDLTYTIIPQIRHLPQSLQNEVRDAFVDSLRVVWFALLGIAAVGWLCVWALKELPLHSQTDDRWAMEDSDEARQRTHADISLTGVDIKEGEVEVSNASMSAHE